MFQGVRGGVITFFSSRHYLSVYSGQGWIEKVRWVWASEGCFFLLRSLTAPKTPPNFPPFGFSPPTLHLLSCTFSANTLEIFFYYITNGLTIPTFVLRFHPCNLQKFADSPPQHSTSTLNLLWEISLIINITTIIGIHGNSGPYAVFLPLLFKSMLNSFHCCLLWHFGFWMHPWL